MTEMVTRVVLPEEWSRGELDPSPFVLETEQFARSVEALHAFLNPSERCQLLPCDLAI